MAQPPRIIDGLEWSPVALVANLTASSEIGNDYVKLVPASGHQIASLGGQFPSVRNFSNRFRDQFREKVTPSWIIMCRSVAERHTNGDPLVAFRDSLCASTVLLSRQSRLLGSTSFGSPAFSDAFEFYPWMLDVDLNDLIIANHEVKELHSVASFLGQCSPQVVSRTIDSADIDKFLLERLLAEWVDFFVKRGTAWEARSLFRSLQVAYHAQKLPSGYYTSVLDAGRLIVQWVSACEILVHDGKRSDLKAVLDVLGRYQFEREEDNTKGECLTVRGGKICANTLQKTYWHLNKARNAFVHGNPIEQSIVHHDGSNRKLLDLAPMVFRMLLEVRLNSFRKTSTIGVGEGEGIRIVEDNRSRSEAKLRYECALLGTKP